MLNLYTKFHLYVKPYLVGKLSFVKPNTQNHKLQILQHKVGLNKNTTKRRTINAELEAADIIFGLFNVE